LQEEILTPEEVEELLREVEKRFGSGRLQSGTRHLNLGLVAQV